MKIFRLFLIFISAATFAGQSFAAISLSVKNEDIPKTKILFFGFNQADPNLQKDVSGILDRIKRNLNTTDLFEVVKQTGQMEMKSSDKAATANPGENLVRENLTVESIPNFEKYSKAGIGAIVIGQFNYDQMGNLEIRVRMWDVLDQRQLFGKLYTASKDNHRKASNVISDEIFKAITGEKMGHFTSRIVYISEVGPLNKRIKKINVVDFDGENHRVLTDGRDLVLTPIFSRKPDQIFYLRYFENRPQIFSLDMKNSRSKKVGGFKGTTLSPSINPKDESVILLSAITDGNSDIYEMDISKNTAKKLTKSSAIDTTPSYSPDGKQIAFSSDRDSGQQIYMMDNNGSSVQKISSGNGSYSKPMWSPDGKLIAFTRIKNGQFFIGVMLPNGKAEKLLTGGYLVEGAKWSPNGRYIIYSKKKGPYGNDSIPRLYIIDIITGFEFEFPTPANEGATDPDWA